MPDTNVAQRKNKFKAIKPLWFVFILSIFVFITDFIYVVLIKKVLFNEVPLAYTLVTVGSILVGIISFFLIIILGILRRHSKGERITLIEVIKACLALPILPIYLLIANLIDKNYRWFVRFFRGSISFLLLLPFWILGYVVLYYVSTDELLLGTRYQVSPIAYSESMEPTLRAGSIGKYYPYKNIVYKLNINWAYKINRGDIITFKNDLTKSYLSMQNINAYSDFAKRVIAIEGDEVELRAGVVLLNDKPLDEPYTLEPNSTFALTDSYKLAKSNALNGLFLEECAPITVPKNKLFVLGDNRKNSNDSRVIGFVDLNDIHGYFPYDEQKQPFKEGVNVISYSNKWRSDSTSLNSEIIQKVEGYCK